MRQIPTLVSYQKAVMRACGEEALPHLESDDTNVAHWFKVPPIRAGVTFTHLMT